MDDFIGGVCGRFTPPGPSGCPTRGNAGILPTGRNFYSVDPGAMPSRASWEVGKVLAGQLIERYMKDDGKYPKAYRCLFMRPKPCVITATTSPKRFICSVHVLSGLAAQIALSVSK
jgi:hypothetical protein